MAKASILWLVGEYCALVPKIAPDVLRKAAKNFLEEVRVYTMEFIFVVFIFQSTFNDIHWCKFLICAHEVVVQNASFA